MAEKNNRMRYSQSHENHALHILNYFVLISSASSTFYACKKCTKRDALPAGGSEGRKNVGEIPAPITRGVVVADDGPFWPMPTTAVDADEPAGDIIT